MGNKIKTVKEQWDKPLKGTLANGEIGQYSSAPFFREKDKKAAEFLKLHPIPTKLLQ